MVNKLNVGSLLRGRGRSIPEPLCIHFGNVLIYVNLYYLSFYELLLVKKYF